MVHFRVDVLLNLLLKLPVNNANDKGWQYRRILCNVFLSYLYAQQPDFLEAKKGTI